MNVCVSVFVCLFLNLKTVEEALEKLIKSNELKDQKSIRNVDPYIAIDVAFEVTLHPIPGSSQKRKRSIILDS